MGDPYLPDGTSYGDIPGYYDVLVTCEECGCEDEVDRTVWRWECPECGHTMEKAIPEPDELDDRHYGTFEP